MTEAGNLNDVLQRYRRIVGVAAPEVLQPAPSMSESLPTKTSDFLPSLRNSPSILAKQALYQAAEFGKHVAQGRMSPKLEFRAATGKDKNDPPGSSYRDAQNSNVQLVLSYNLFRGGADMARIRQTTAQQYAARDVRDYTCRNVQQDLSVAWNNVQRLRAQLPFLQQHELATSKVRVAYMQQFQIGQRSLLDLLDTENELFDARRALANATYDLQQAEYSWLMLSHRLVSAVGLAQPYSEQPDEAAKLDFPEEAFQACMTPVPDTSNLTPITVDYRDDMAPPVLREKTAGLN
ncbi:MAG: TolC family protein [Alcaligenes aquatilis]